jgi:hypothetical protein
MNSFEKNKLIISNELEKKKEIRDFLIKERKRLLKPNIYSIYFFIIIIIIFAFINIGVAILSIVLFLTLLYFIDSATFFPRGHQIEEELSSIKEDILRLEIEKINSEFLEIKNFISESETF